MQHHIDTHWHAVITNTAFLRLHQIIGDPHSTPPKPPLIPVSKSTWYRGVSDGRFSAPVKDISPGCSLWRTEAILELLHAGDSESA